MTDLQIHEYANMLAKQFVAAHKLGDASAFDELVFECEDASSYSALTDLVEDVAHHVVAHLARSTNLVLPQLPCHLPTA